MIYNEKLTRSLIKELGVKVKAMRKSTIRIALEDLSDYYKSIYLSTGKNKHLVKYKHILDLDNQFTEEYINELDNK